MPYIGVPELVILLMFFILPVAIIVAVVVALVSHPRRERTSQQPTPSLRQHRKDGE